LGNLECFKNTETVLECFEMSGKAWRCLNMSVSVQKSKSEYGTLRRRTLKTDEELGNNLAKHGLVWPCLAKLEGSG
jgi:hypothetical protein